MAKKISFVIPCLNEEQNLPILFKKLKSIECKSKYEFNYIVVDDGSTDQTWLVVNKLSKKYTNIKGLRFSRNFGHQHALMAGIRNSGRCSAVIMMDADMQHPPKVAPKLLNKWEEGFDIVHGVRKKTDKEPKIKKLLSKTFYKISNFFLDYKLVHNSSDFRLLDRKVVKYIKSLQEHNIFLRGITSWVGFNQSSVYFKAPSRYLGKPSYSFKKSFKLATNGIVSLSAKPLSLISSIGAFLTLFSTLALLVGTFRSYTAGWRLYYSPTVWLMLVNMFLIGLVLVCLGMVAIYISFVYQEVVKRPLYIVSDKTQNLKKVS